MPRVSSPVALNEILALRRLRVQQAAQQMNTRTSRRGPASRKANVRVTGWAATMPSAASVAGPGFRGIPVEVYPPWAYVGRYGMSTTRRSSKV